MTVGIFVLSLLAAMAIGMPIAYSLLVCGLCLMAYLAATGVLPAFDSQILAQRFVDGDRKSTRLNYSHVSEARMPSSA